MYQLELDRLKIYLMGLFQKDVESLPKTKEIIESGYWQRCEKWVDKEMKNMEQKGRKELPERSLKKHIEDLFLFRGGGTKDDLD